LSNGALEAERGREAERVAEVVAHRQQLPAEIPIRPTVVPYPLAEADRALSDLAGDRLTGAAILHVAH